MSDELWEHVRAERRDLIALLEQLSPAEWDQATLCSDWRVRDVVAHLTAATDWTFAQVTTGMAQARFDFDRFMSRLSRQRGEAPVPELLDRFRACVDSRRSPPGTSGGHVLCDTMCHHQDIRRPLGRPRQVPEARLRAALDVFVTLGPPFHGRRRARGFAWHADDLGWRHGSGPELRGPGEAVLLAIGGRREALADLSGDGAEMLRARA